MELEFAFGKYTIFQLVKLIPARNSQEAPTCDIHCAIMGDNEGVCAKLRIRCCCLRFLILDKCSQSWHTSETL